MLEQKIAMKNDTIENCSAQVKLYGQSQRLTKLSVLSLQ